MSFLKNIVTLGGHNKLERQINEMKGLRVFSNKLKETYDSLVIDKNKATKILEEERRDAIKNINLAKNLIKRIHKNTKGSEQKVIKDLVLENEELILKLFNFNSNLALDQNLKKSSKNVSIAVSKSVNNNFIKKLSNRKNISKEDLKEAAITTAVEVGTEVIMEGFSYITTTNSDVNSKRREVNSLISEINKHISQLYKIIPQNYAYLRRVLEISKVLNKNNQVFTIQYEKLHKKLFSKNNKYFFITNKIKINTEDDLKELQSLILITSNYSELNKNIKIQ